MLRKNPGFAAVVALTLALGIGANTAIFSVVNSVLLKPLPFKDPNRLVLIWETDKKNRAATSVICSLDFIDWKDQTRVFQQIAAWRSCTSICRGETSRSAFRDLLFLPRSCPCSARRFNSDARFCRKRSNRT